jgi:hypothetical protein
MTELQCLIHCADVGEFFPHNGGLCGELASENLDKGLLAHLHDHVCLLTGVSSERFSLIMLCVDGEWHDLAIAQSDFEKVDLA